MQVLALTGQRRDEVGRIEWEHLDLTRKVWAIPGEHAKNGKPHLVQLSKPVLAILEVVPRTGDLVFSGDGKTVFQGYSKAKARLDRLSGVSDWTLHDLRRTVVSGMARLWRRMWPTKSSTIKVVRSRVSPRCTRDTSSSRSESWRWIFGPSMSPPRVGRQ